ncbi:MAG: NgoFVII family restriction endonuclease, partial [Oceanispirochaeta sp.]
LNWGHGEKRTRRNKNEAYIQLSPEVYKSDFFPKKGQHFTVVTDDSKLFICTRAQKKDTDGTAIETPHNNSLLGEYFRNRLGLVNGAFITKNELQQYGRTDVTFYKFDDENYYMDFEVK